MAMEPVDIPDQAKPDSEELPRDERPKVEREPVSERMRGGKKLKSQIAELYATIGMVAITPIDRLGGYLLAANADELAEQWVTLADTNPTVRRALEKLVEAGGWGGVIMAHGMIVLPVLANRGLLPDQIAAGAAMVTVTTHPETADMFTHPRFGNVAQQEQGPHVVNPNTNGDNGN